MAKVKILIDQALEAPCRLNYYSHLPGDIEEKSIDGKTIDLAIKKFDLCIMNK